MEKDKYREQFSSSAAAAFRKEYPDLYNEIGDAEMFDAEVLYHLLEKPKDPRMGRFALPVFRFVRRLSQKPLDVASRIAASTNRLLASDGHDSPLLASATGGFINVNIDQAHLAGEILNKILSAPAQYGESHIGSGKTVLVEYSSPNIAKPFGVGHLRTTIIGNSLRRVFKKLGYDVVGINYPGDWGTQFGKMIVAYRRWGSEQTFQGDVIHNLLDLYVRFHREAESNASLDEEAREAFRKLEAGDDQYLKMWEQFKQVSYAEFQRIYDLMGVEFDQVIGESFLNDKMDTVIERLKRDGLVRISDGAMIVDIDDPNLPPAMLRKADGATLYLTRDLTGAIYRWETYHFAESLYVVGSSQADHFRQMLHVLGKMKAAENVPEDQRMVNRIKHIDFGWVRFGRKTMATRQGNIIFLEDVITRAVELVKEIMHEKNPDLPQLEKIAQMVGVGAVFYSQLSVRRNKDVNFVWEDVLNFEGESGPYVQ